MVTLESLTETERNDLQMACRAWNNRDSVTPVATPAVVAYMIWDYEMSLPDAVEVPAPVNVAAVDAFITVQHHMWELLKPVYRTLMELDAEYMSGATNQLAHWRFESWAEPLMNMWARDLDEYMTQAYEWLATRG
jgi:hypothetical protein